MCPDVRARMRLCRAGEGHVQASDLSDTFVSFGKVSMRFMYIILPSLHILAIGRSWEWEKYLLLERQKIRWMRPCKRGSDVLAVAWLCSAREEEMQASDVFDMLVSFADFDAFKDIMLSHKNVRALSRTYA